MNSRQSRTIRTFIMAKLPQTKQEWVFICDKAYHIVGAPDIAFRRRTNSLLVSSPSRVVAIDPGVRRFATTYSPEGSATIDGNNILDYLSRCLDRTKTTQLGRVFTDLW